MIFTIAPDPKGRCSLLQTLKLMGWKPGEGIEVNFIKTVPLGKHEIGE